MNVPQSTPHMAVVPLSPIPIVEGGNTDGSEPTLLSMNPSRYSLFLQGRLSELEFLDECQSMERALRSDEALLKKAREMDQFMGLMGAKGCHCDCCCMFTLTMLCCGIPMVYYALKMAQLAPQLRLTWLRVMQAECDRLNAKYASRQLRFEVSQDARSTGYTTGNTTTTSSWVAISIGAPQMQQQGPPVAYGQQPQYPPQPQQYPQQYQAQAQYPSYEHPAPGTQATSVHPYPMQPQAQAQPHAYMQPMPYGYNAAPPPHYGPPPQQQQQQAPMHGNYVQQAQALPHASAPQYPYQPHPQPPPEHAQHYAQAPPPPPPQYGSTEPSATPVPDANSAFQPPQKEGK